MHPVFLYSSRREVEAFVERLEPSIEIGVGKAAAAARVARALALRSHPLAILCGVAGAYRESGLSVGDVCVVGSSVLADEGVATSECDFIDLADLGLAVTQPERRVGCEAQACAALGVRSVRAATVSTCSGHDAAADRMAARSRAAVETMESAAVAFACAEAGTSLLEVRAISNFCGDRDRAEWDLPKAVAALDRAMLDVVEALRNGVIGG